MFIRQLFKSISWSLAITCIIDRKIHRLQEEVQRLKDNTFDADGKLILTQKELDDLDKP